MLERIQQIAGGPGLIPCTLEASSEATSFHSAESSPWVAPRCGLSLSPTLKPKQNLSSCNDWVPWTLISEVPHVYFYLKLVI